MISDLEIALRLKEMPYQTRSSTIKSLRKLRQTAGNDGDLSVEDVRHIVAYPDPKLRNNLGHKASQVFSDSRRALKVWDEYPIQRLAIKLRGKVVTLEHAIDAAHLNFPPERATRAEMAMRAFAKHLNQPVEAIIATEAVVGPKLIALTPEDLAVGTDQTLKNKKTLIRSALRLVDPVCLGRMHSDTTRLPEVWSTTLEMLVSRAPKHSPSIAAIFRRLATRSDFEGMTPDELTKGDLEGFLYQERQTHAKPFGRKLGMAIKIWNGAINEGALNATPFIRSRQTERLPDVPWGAVPLSIREPLDALLGRASIADRSGGVWEDLIDDDLGVPDAETNGEAENVDLTIDPATAELWRRSLKRIWHAAAHDEGGKGAPETLETLFTVQNARSFVTAVWTCRKKNLDKAGEDWESNKKGIYETGLLRTFVNAGRILGVEDSQLEKIRAFINKIDPAVVGKKRMPDGTTKLIYEETRIGPKHADMLRAFNHDSVLARWFKAPELLWAAALKGKSRKNGFNEHDAALARSALILQILQRVSPLRRNNLARLRISGPNPHIHLPVGNGEGRLLLPAVELKNLRAIEVRIDADTVRMIREFVKTFRPFAIAREGVSDGNEHLFPGATNKRPEHGFDAEYSDGYGYHSPNAFSAMYSKHMMRKCALKVDMHVARHIAAKVILDIDPSAMGLVQEILEHRRIETTRAYYAEVSKLIAQKRYLQLLDKATLRALGKIDFRVEFEKQLGA